jgi:hypothetical protein
MIIKAILLIKTEDMGMAIVRTFLAAELDTDTSLLTGRIEREVDISIDENLIGKKDQVIRAAQTIGMVKPLVVDCWDWLDGMGSANKAGNLIEITISQEAFNG